MKEDKEFLLHKSKEDTRLAVNRSLLAVCFALFTFIIALNPDLLKQNAILTLQLVCSIPLLMTSILARAKSVYTPQRKRWKNFGFVSYLLGYSFLINVVGIFLISYVTLSAGIIFFGMNVILALAYSVMEVSYDSSRFLERLIKDLTFSLIIIFLGLLPALGFY